MHHRKNLRQTVAVPIKLSDFQRHLPITSLLRWDFYGRPIGQAIVFCSCGFFFLFFLACSPWSQIGCLIHPHMMCLSANLECRSEMCCTRLAENTGFRNSPSAHYRTSSLEYIFTTKTCIDNRKKLVKQQYLGCYLLHMSSQYGELRPTNG